MPSRGCLSPGPGHPLALWPAPACWAPFASGAGSGGGACVPSHQAGGLTPLVPCAPPSFLLSALQAFGEAPVPPAIGLSPRPPGATGGGG